MRSKNCALTQNRLLQLLKYDPQTGEFTWRVRRNGRGGINIGDVAGKTMPKTGYISIGVDRREYLAHRLAFLYMTGVWPPDQIDHRDRNRSNNSWENLRPSTQKQNLENISLRSDNRSGITGVHWRNQSQRWFAEIFHHGKRIHLGSFRTKEEAALARMAGIRKFFTHHG